MQIRTLFLGAILSFFSFTALAGTGHDHGHSHSHTAVKSNATEIVAALVKRNTLDNSWSSIGASSVEKITVQGNPEWVVVFVNNKAADKGKRKLYVFLTLGGDYIAANFTGK
jgi:hypothetical protein